jgi:hypothetical protein
VTPGIGRASIVHEDAMTETIAPAAGPTVKEQASALLAHAAGYASHRTIAMGLRSVPGRIMGGIQFFEAQIDDQLLPRAYYDGLLTRHQFTDLGSASLTPMHALTWGRRPVP